MSHRARSRKYGGCKNNGMWFYQKLICDERPVNRGMVKVQNPVVGKPLLRELTAHSIGEALEGCFAELSIHTLSSRDKHNEPAHQYRRRQSTDCLLPISLTAICHSAHMISCTCAAISSV